MVLIIALLEHFGIVAKFPWRKSSSISPYFCGRNPASLRLKCFITHKTLFSPNFHCENMATKMPYFSWWKSGRVLHLVHYGALVGFHAYVHDMRQYVHTKASQDFQSIKKGDTCCIHEETNVTIWHGSRQTHYNNHAHNIAWVCTYGDHLKRISILQGQVYPWSWEGYSPNHESPLYKVHNLAGYRKDKSNIAIP